MKELNLNQLRAMANDLGYGIQVRKKSSIDNIIHRYRTSPISGGGSTNYFDSKASLQQYLERSKLNREWQLDVAAEFKPDPTRCICHITDSFCPIHNGTGVEK